MPHPDPLTFSIGEIAEADLDTVIEWLSITEHHIDITETHLAQLQNVHDVLAQRLMEPDSLAESVG